jgi:hypothetical protein
MRQPVIVTGFAAAVHCALRVAFSFDLSSFEYDLDFNDV